MLIYTNFEIINSTIPPSKSCFYFGFDRIAYIDTVVPQVLTLYDLINWGFPINKQDEKKYKHFITKSEEISFYTREDAEFFMNNFLLPNMIASNLISKERYFKV